MSFHKVSVLIVFLILLLALVVPVSATVLIVNLTEDTADEYVGETTNADFFTMRNDTGDLSADMVHTGSSVLIQASTTSQVYDIIRRAAYGFNTSALPDDAEINSVVFSVYPYTKVNNLGNLNLGITGFSPATANDFVQGDYDSFGNTIFAPNISFGSIPTNTSYLNFTFNSDGIAAINKTGYTNFMLRFVQDIFNSNTSMTWSSGAFTGIQIWDYNEFAGKEPFLTIVYNTIPTASFTSNTTRGTIPLAVGFTDTSADSPTSWAWYIDGVQFSTDQNPALSISDVGTFDIGLYASNEHGGTWYNQTDLITTNDVAPDLGEILPDSWTAVIPGGGETFGCLLRDINLSVVTDENGLAYMYTIQANATPEYGNVRTFNLTDFSIGSPEVVLPTDIDTGDVHSPHYVIKVASDFYVMFYTSENTLGGDVVGIRAATSSTPNGTFTNVSKTNFNVYYSNTGWDYGKTLEQDVGAVKISENDTFAEYWMLYSTLSGTVGQQGWYKAIINKTGKTVTYPGNTNGGKYTNNPISLFNSNSNRAGGSMPFKVGDYYIMLSLIKNPGNEIGALYSTDPLFATVNQTATWGGPLTYNSDGEIPEPHDESYMEKFDSYSIGSNLYVLSESAMSAGTDDNKFFVGVRVYGDFGIPVASFTANATSGTVPLAVGFADTSTNIPTDWDWYINDVKFSDLQNPEYTFTEAGVYDVSLYAANGASGDWENKTDYITATNWYDLQCENQTGNITINLFSNSTSSLGWNWNDPVNITKIAEDGLYILTFDNSSDSFIGTGYVPESWHKLRIYNETDFGQLNCTTDALPIIPTPIPIMPSTESNVNPANLFQYWPYALLALGLVVVFKKW